MASTAETTKSVDKSTSHHQQKAFSSSQPSLDHKKNVLAPSSKSSQATHPVSCGAFSSQPAHSVIVTSSDGTSNPSRVLGWKASKTFSKTMSSIEVSPPLTSHTASCTSKSLTKQQSTANRTYHVHHTGVGGNSSSHTGSGGGGGGGGGASLSASQPRAAAIRIQMAESVGPSAYSLSLQQRNASDQWKLLKNRLLRKKSTDDEEAPTSFPEVVMDRMRQMRRMSPHQQELTGSNGENGIVCRTNELKKLLKSEGDTSGRNSARSSFDASVSTAAVTTSTACVTGTVSTCDTTLNCSNSETSRAKQVSSTQASSSSTICSPTPPIVVCQADVSEAESSSSPLVSSSSSSSAVESTVKWDEVSGISLSHTLSHYHSPLLISCFSHKCCFFKLSHLFTDTHLSLSTLCSLFSFLVSSSLLCVYRAMCWMQLFSATLFKIF